MGEYGIMHIKIWYESISPVVFLRTYKNKSTQGNLGRCRMCLLPWLWWWYHGCFICPNSSNVHIQYVHFFVYQLYVSKSVEKYLLSPLRLTAWLKWDWRKLNTLEEHLIFFRGRWINLLANNLESKVILLA